jgi:hypothetical protein
VAASLLNIQQKGETMYQTKMTSMFAAVLFMAMFGSACAQAENQSERRATKASAPHNQLLAQATKAEQKSEQQLFQGNQTVFGRVEAVTSDQIKVNIGELQPRYLPLKTAEEKNFPEIKAGDDLVITVNAQNMIVDYHALDHPSGGHKIVQGAMADTMPVGHERVVIKNKDGKEQSFEVRSQARSKLAAIPVGAPAIFLIDESNKVTDATFASLDAAKKAQKRPEDKSSIKGANRQVDGTVVEPLHGDRITIKTGDGERPFEVRELMQERLSKLSKGESVVLLVDKENKVVDIAVPPASAR